MKNTAILAVLCALARKVSATCAEEMPNLPQPGQTHRTSIMVDDPNYGQVDPFWEDYFQRLLFIDIFQYF